MVQHVSLPTYTSNGRTEGGEVHTCAVTQDSNCATLEAEVAKSNCRMLIGWQACLYKEGSNSRVHQELRMIKKRIKYTTRKTQTLVSVTLFIVFNNEFHFSFLYVISPLSSVAVYETNNKNKSGPQTSCSTYFLHCLNLTAKLTVGRQAVPGVERTAKALP